MRRSGGGRQTRARSARRAGARGELPCDGSLLIAHRGGAGGSLVAAEASEWSGGPGQPHDSHPAPASGARADVAQRALASSGQRQLYRSVHLPGRQPGASAPPTGAPVAPSGKSGAQPRAGHAWRGAGGCLDDRSARSCAFAYCLCLLPRVCECWRRRVLGVPPLTAARTTVRPRVWPAPAARRAGT